jgi:hypothetical protein
MPRFPHLTWPGLIAAAALLGACAAGGPAGAAAPQRTLTAYSSEAEFETALERWRAESRRRQEAGRRQMADQMVQSAPAPMAAAPAAPAAAKAEADKASESITNVQTAGVDEGGIVKRAGDHLVILRRGRLFTVRVGGDLLQPQSMIDAYAPGADARGAWYDEMLISGSTVVVVGYSYARGGTEIGLFEIGREGALAYRATYHLRSFDYYSARNYASRLIGSKLIFYTPTVLTPWGQPLAQVVPAMRRWDPRVPQDFQRILPATRIFRTDDDFEPGTALALHTVTTCELTSEPMRCDSTAVLGPPGRVFYVSAGSVYVWTNTWRRSGPRPEAASAQSAVFRLPLEGGGAPTGLKTVGVPIDQLSFLEDGSAHLNVLVRETGPGEGMFGGERSQGRLALLRVPLAEFGDGKQAASRDRYRLLPGQGFGRLQNRYVGDWLLWGGEANAWGLRFAGADDAVALAPGHAVERIEALGANALLVGNLGSELHFSAVRLARGAQLAGKHVQAGARQGETRTHGFFYRAIDANEGLLGLPVLGPADPARHGVYARGAGSASVVFLRQRELNFSALGQLDARRDAPADDGCKASCVDWYGNARPIFMGERIFALMGYELVEGRLVGRGMAVEERRRVDFTPAVAQRSNRPTPFQ